jgi:hypothetical protein
MQETIDAFELAKRWGVPVSWVRNHTRTGYTRDPIPHLQFGRYIRFEWGSLALEAWLSRHTQGGGAHK